jgi:hypothetical protein
MPGIEVEINNTHNRDPALFEEQCYECFNLIVERTPVDTGFCQDGWEIEAAEEGTFIIYNRTEYVSYLEDGWSKQAPSGFVRISIEEIFG